MREDMRTSNEMELSTDLRDAVEFVDEAPGSSAGLDAAKLLASQSAGLAGLCAIALDAAARSGCASSLPVEEIARSSSKIMMKCWDDLTVAANLIG